MMGPGSYQLVSRVSRSEVSTGQQPSALPLQPEKRLEFDSESAPFIIGSSFADSSCQQTPLQGIFMSCPNNEACSMAEEDDHTCPLSTIPDFRAICFSSRDRILNLDKMQSVSLGTLAP